MQMPAIQGFSHMALSVTDSKRSADFYAELLGGQVMDISDSISPFHICIAGSTIVGCRAHPGIDAADAFDHNRVGLDHVAFAVATAGELEEWRERLDDLGVKHSGVQEDPSGFHLNARDPDNIAIEFFVMRS
jgi:catechol 2,3-dioxygenase-like lactoylglutathione lyase family enzyme